MANIISNGMLLGTIMQDYKVELTLVIGVFIFLQHPASLLGIEASVVLVSMVGYLFLYI
jgi:hypothetical protein